MEITACIVNYATPEMTARAVWSLRTCQPELSIVVIDSGSPDDSVARLWEVAEAAGGVEVVACDRNVHHGPGLDLALREHVQTPWALLFDSDCLAFRAGFLEAMLAKAERSGAYLVGPLQHVDADGFNVAADAPEALPYVHPHCALVRRATYLDLPPFQKHGAPCLANQIEAHRRGLPLVHFSVADYVFHLGRGTVRAHGYNLGAGSRLAQLRRRLRRLFG